MSCLFARTVSHFLSIALTAGCLAFFLAQRNRRLHSSGTPEECFQGTPLLRIDSIHNLDGRLALTGWLREETVPHRILARADLEVNTWKQYAT